MPRRASLFGSRRRRAKGAGGLVALLLLGAAIYLIQAFWPVLAAGAVACIALAITARHQRQQRLRALEIAQIDRLTGQEFERYLSRLFTYHGYTVQQTGKAGDQGCDLVLTKDDKRIACQVKRYSRPVSNDAVAEAVAAKAFYGCNEAMVVTNSRFTRSARKLAAANACRLINRVELGELIRQFQES